GRAVEARHVLHDRAHGQSRQAAGENPVRWMDGGDERPLALGAVRAFGRRDGGGRGDFHAVADGSRQSFGGSRHSSVGLRFSLLPIGRCGRADMKAKTQPPDGLREAAEPHFHGHRQRLRERFMEAGAGALADYELIELVLFRAIPRRDVKPLAKALIARFGSFAEAIAAPRERLREVNGMSEGAVAQLKIIEAAALRLSKTRVMGRPALSSWAALIDYCAAAMARSMTE